MTDKKKHGTEEKHGQQPVPDAAKPEMDAEALRAELEQVRAQADEYLDGWKRAQADLVNYRKRVERDAAEVRLQAAGRAVSRWFSVLDDFERALKEIPDPANCVQWAGGVELIYRKSLAALEAEGVTPIEPEAGADFDPNLHEAITREMCPDRRDGEILEVVHRGYRLGDRVLRPAKVRVACKPAPNAEPSE
jgi:molecular chaperone GrpE